MVRIILGIFAGIIVGALVVSIVEGVGHMIWPPPPGNLKDPEYLKSIMHLIPLPAKFAVLVAWGSGIFAGGVMARFISRGAPYAAFIVGAFLLGGGLYTMYKIPHPSWMVWNAIAISIVAVLLANRVTAGYGKR